MFTLGHLLAARKLASSSVPVELPAEPVRKKVSRSEIERLFETDFQAHTEVLRRGAGLGQTFRNRSVAGS